LAGLELLLFDDLEPAELILEGLLFLPAVFVAGLTFTEEPDDSKLLPGLYLFCVEVPDEGFLYEYLAFVFVLAGFLVLVVTSFCGLVLTVAPVPDTAGLPLVLPSATVPVVVVDVLALVLSITALDEPAPAILEFAGIDFEEVVVPAIAGLCFS
jgi:hypothetical protein